VWQFARVSLRVLSAVALCYLVWVFASRHFSTQRWVEEQKSVDDAAARANFQRIYGGSALKILQFYAREGQLVEGRSTVLCYGVLNAARVSIAPVVEGVSPALNRCVAIAPRRDTTYVLTAEGADGGTSSASLTVTVGPDVATLPRITSFRVIQQRVDAGRPVYLLGFSAVNGEEVSIDPAVFPTLHGAPNGQFWVAPDAATTYTLIVKGSRGRVARERLTVGSGGR